jgi:uncharacterized beta-barrel protein YwiB (DUF1934 family)
MPTMRSVVWWRKGEKNMKIPNKLKILGHEVTVIESDSLDGSGEFDKEKMMITIYSKSAQSWKEETLIHEILHVINSELTEKDVDFLAQTLYAVIKDNNLL